MKKSIFLVGFIIVIAIAAFFVFNSSFSSLFKGDIETLPGNPPSSPQPLPPAELTVKGISIKQNPYNSKYYRWNIDFDNKNIPYPKMMDVYFQGLSTTPKLVNKTEGIWYVMGEKINITNIPYQTYGEVIYTSGDIPKNRLCIQPPVPAFNYGTSSITVTLDGGGKIFETNENDNVKSLVIPCSGLITGTSTMTTPFLLIEGKVPGWMLGSSTFVY